jgi:hypothetical protein
MARLGNQFEFIRCGAEDDPMVWNVAAWEPRERIKSHDSVSEWLLAWLTEAEEARASSESRSSQRHG